ncbi:MAG: hypothetical protein U0325_28085 [Polyangiales bacterium]
MSDRTYRTTVSTDQLVSGALVIGLAASGVATVLLHSLTAGVALGGAVGLLASALWVDGLRAQIRVDAEGLTLTRRWRTEHIPHADIRQVIAEPGDVSGFRGQSDAMSVTLLREGGQTTQLEVATGDADPLLAEISAPMVRRWRSALAQGEHVEFRDPRLFPTRSVLRSLAVSVGALFLLVSAVVAFRFDLALTVALLGVFVSSLRRAWRAGWAWRAADRGGGLAVSSQGVQVLAQVPRVRLAGPVYRAAELSGPWIPWAALRGVQREGFGLVVETDTIPAQIRLSPSTEGVAALGQLLDEQTRAWAHASFVGDGRVRVEADVAPAGDDVAVADARPAEGARRAR